MDYSLILYSEKVFIENKFQAATIFIKKNKIVQIENSRVNLPELVDVGKQMILPGIIDAHVHINEPGRTDWEGFETATKAAIAGGTTTVVDMPLNSSPVTTTKESFDKKLVASQGKLYANCGFWGGVVPSNAADLTEILESGVLGIKAFLTHSGIDEFPNVTREDLEKAMPQIAAYNLPLLVHCELESPTPAIEQLKANPRSYTAYLASRPKSWENEAIVMMIELCRRYNCKTHIVHVSSGEALEKIANAKAEGLPLTAETCPQYLFFNAENIEDGDTRFKCAPPIREAANNEELWKALSNGVLDFITTDHSPAPSKIKEIDTGNFYKAWGGIAGLQFLLSSIWTKARERNIPLEKIIPMLTTKPAGLAGLDSYKGEISEGYDADLVVFDPDVSFEVKQENILHKHKVTPYIGQSLYGKVLQTYINGKLAFEGESIIHSPFGKTILGC